MSQTGTWGDATKATAENGEFILQSGVESVINLMTDIETTFRELTLR
jgi:creatinine amidohydrolase/Fe(II)-dependent formamide hydrolase-like protein